MKDLLIVYTYPANIYSWVETNKAEKYLCRSVIAGETLEDLKFYRYVERVRDKAYQIFEVTILQSELISGVGFPFPTNWKMDKNAPRKLSLQDN